MTTLAVPEEGRIDFSSRISARAVTLGTIVALAVLSVLLSLGGAFGLLPTGSVLNAEALRRAGDGLIIWGALSWIIAAFAGAFAAAVSARSTLSYDGVLHGVATWAAACLTAGVLACVWYMAALRVGLAWHDVAGLLMSKTACWGYFFADLLALAAAFAGGLLGARSEIRAPRRMELRREEAVPLAPSHHVPQPT